MELSEKNRKEDEEKAKLQQKQNLELLKKIEAEQAYQEWLRKKQEEKKIKELINQSNTESNKNLNGNQRRNSISNKKKHLEDKLKMNIGPYSIAKELREYKRKLVEDLEERENWDSSQALNEQQQPNENNNNYNHCRDLKNQQYEDQEEEYQEAVENKVYKSEQRKDKAFGGKHAKNANEENEQQEEEDEDENENESFKGKNLNNNNNKNVAFNSKKSKKPDQQKLQSTKNNKVIYRREKVTDPNYEQEYEANYAQAGNYNNEISDNEISENLSNKAHQYQNEQEEYENENANYNNKNSNKNNAHGQYLDHFEKEKIEDSLQELSSIKKDTPAQDDD
jgi:hypothetical protein